MAMLPEDSLGSLAAASARLQVTIGDLRDEAATHAAATLAALQALHSARGTLAAEQSEGAELRQTHKLMSEIEAARALLERGAVEEAVRQLESVARCTFGQNSADADVSSIAAAVQAKPSSADTARKLAAQAAAADVATTGEWTAFLTAGAESLFHGARALTLAPPGGLSSGIDGLDGERAQLVRARGILARAERVEGLLELMRAHAKCDHDGATLVERLASSFRQFVQQRLTSELQVAQRLANYAAGGSAPDSSTLLEALAEASEKASKVVRSLGAVFGLLALPEPTAAPGGASAQPPTSPTSAPPSEAVLATQELAGESDALLAQLSALPRPADPKRPTVLRGVGTATCELLGKQLEAASSLVGAAESARGRRALSMLGEGGERLAAAVRAQAKAERAGQ